MENEQRKAMSIAKALQQNAEFFGFDLQDDIELPDGTVVSIIHREFLDADKKLKVDQIYREHDQCDRHKIEVTDDEGKITTIEGGFKEPREKDGELFELDARLGRVLWGSANYDKFVAAGGPPQLISVTWSRMRHQINRRLSAEPKSN